MPPSPKILQLRQLLSERFPGARFSAEALIEAPANVYPTGLGQIDAVLRGGLPKGATTEIVAGKNSSGSALLISALLQKAAKENQILALVDGQDSFDPAGFENKILSRLLWVR